MKHWFTASAGIVGSIISGIFGGWTTAMTTLLIFMVVDYVTGFIVAGVFHASPKSDSGALESRAGWKGLCRKGAVLAFVLIGYRLDLAIGASYIKDAVCIAFIANELLSIVENAGLMGVPIPNAIMKGIEILKRRSEPPDDEPEAQKQ